MIQNLSEMCSIKKGDFDLIFQDFFVIHRLDKNKDIIDKISDIPIYKTCEIHKVEIRKGLNEEDFINGLLQYINEYFYDGNKNGSKHEGHKKKALEFLNQYTAKTGILLDEFKNNEITNGKKGNEFIQQNDSEIIGSIAEKKVIRDYIKQYSINNVDDLLPNSKYVILTKQNKISIMSTDEILGYLHGDIGEMILFFLTESLLGYPILFSKVKHSKSSKADKVKGSDGIHISKDATGLPIFHFLESKLRHTFSESLRDAIDSQIKFIKNAEDKGISNEIFILNANSTTIDAYYKETIFQNGFEEYIDPYFLGNNSIQQRLPFTLISGLIYECSDYKKHKEGIHADYINTVLIEKIRKIILDYGVHEELLVNRKVDIFLLPLISDTKLIQTFLKKIKVN